MRTRAGNAESPEDLSGYMDPADFGVSVFLPKQNRSINALLDNDEEEIEPEFGNQPVIAARIRITVRSIDLTGVDLGDTLEIDEDSFEITTRLNSGDGLTVLRLVEI